MTFGMLDVASTDLWLLLRVFSRCSPPGKPGFHGKACTSLSRWERRRRYPGGKWSRRSGPHSRCQVGAGMCLSSLGSTLQLLIPGLALFPGAPGLWHCRHIPGPAQCSSVCSSEKFPLGWGSGTQGWGTAVASQSSGIPGFWGGIRSGCGPALGWGRGQGTRGSSSGSSRCFPWDGRRGTGGIGDVGCSSCIPSFPSQIPHSQALLPQCWALSPFPNPGSSWQGIPKKSPEEARKGQRLQESSQILGMGRNILTGIFLIGRCFRARDLDLFWLQQREEFPEFHSIPNLGS